MSTEKCDEYLAIVQKATTYSALGSGERVLDINSGDGLLLGWYLKSIITAGVETNISLVKEALKQHRVDIPIMEEFSLAGVQNKTKEKGFSTFKIITLIDVLQNMNPIQTLTDCRSLLESEGVLVFQVPYFAQLFKGEPQEFSMDQHYFLTYTIKSLLQRVNLELQGLEVIKTNIRVYATQLGNKKFAVADYTEKLRLYTTMNAAMIHDLHSRFDLEKTYKELEDKLNNKRESRRNNFPSYESPSLE
jgi:hypothetical protein